MSDDWEHRMGERSAQQRAIEDAEQEALNAEIAKEYEKARVEWFERLVEQRVAIMSTQEAQQRLDAPMVACACTGLPYCCRVGYEAARRVLGVPL